MQPNLDLVLFSAMPYKVWETIISALLHFSLSSPTFSLSTPVENSEATWKKATMQQINKLIITIFWVFFDYCGMHYCAVCSETRSLIEKWRLPFKSLSFRVYFIIISSVGPTITGKFLGYNGTKDLLKSNL